MKVSLKNILIPVVTILFLGGAGYGYMYHNMQVQLEHEAFPTYVYLDYTNMYQNLYGAALSEVLMGLFKSGKQAERIRKAHEYNLIVAMNFAKHTEIVSNYHYRFSRKVAAKTYLRYFNKFRSWTRF